jgi:hypothetical protein
VGLVCGGRPEDGASRQVWGRASCPIKPAGRAACLTAVTWVAYEWVAAACTGVSLTRVGAPVDARVDWAVGSVGGLGIVTSIASSLVIHLL